MPYQRRGFANGTAVACRSQITRLRRMTMKNELITTIEQAMLKKLDNAQLQALHEVLLQAFKGVSVTAVADADKAPDNTEILVEFLSAKRGRGLLGKVPELLLQNDNSGS